MATTSNRGKTKAQQPIRPATATTSTTTTTTSPRAAHDREDPEAAYEYRVRKSDSIAAKVSALEKCCYVREVLNDDIFAELAGACGPMLKLRSSKLELARAWEVSNETLEQQFEALATERNFLTPVDGYHCAQFEDIMSIITNGFLTDRNRRSGQGVSVNIHCQNAINFSDENLFCLRCRVNVGKVFPTDEKIEDPALALKVLKDGYHSISLKNSTIVVYHSRQILPKYLFLFKKARKRELSRINTLEALPDVGITITQHNDTLHKCPPAVGRVAMTSDFICVLCTNPMFTHHCIITPRREIIWKELIASDIPLIQRMVEFAETIKLRFEEKEKTSTKAPQQYRIGFLPNPANEQLHCHLVSSTKLDILVHSKVLQSKWDSLKPPEWLLDALRLGTHCQGCKRPPRNPAAQAPAPSPSNSPLSSPSTTTPASPSTSTTTSTSTLSSSSSSVSDSTASASASATTNANANPSAPGQQAQQYDVPSGFGVLALHVPLDVQQDRLITVIEASRAPVESDFDDPDDVELPYPSSTLEITDRDLANIPTVSQLLWSEGNAPVDDVGFWSRAPTAQLLATTLTHLSNAAAKS